MTYILHLQNLVFSLWWCEYSLYVTTYHRRNNGLCNTVVRITHSAVGLEAPGRILTFMVWGMEGVCRGRQKLVLTGIRQEGVEWGKTREDRKGGGGLCQIQDKVRGTKEVWAEECGRQVNQVDGQEMWRLSIISRAPEFSMTSTLHLQARKVAGGQRSQPCISIMSRLRWQARREDTWRQHLEVTHKRRQMGLKDPVDRGQCVP